MRCYLNQADRGACSYYRARLPWKHCADQLKADGIDLVLSETLDTSEEFDAYLVHRVVHPQFMPYLEHIKSRGKKIVVEIDDDVYHIPAWNPAASVFGQKELDTLNRTFDLADQIWVSTAPLAEVINRGDKVKVLPNLIDSNDYPARTRHDDGKVRVLWAGSIHHDADIGPLEPVVEELIRRHGDKVEFIFFGAWPEGLSRWVRIRHTNLATSVPRSDLARSLSYVDPVDLSDYPATLCGLGADIGLCPLADVKFNESKSGIKAMEYALAGAAVIATDLPPYSGLTRHTIPPGNHPGEWARAIDRLIRDRDERAVARNETTRRVLVDHSWQGPRRNLWLDAFRGLA
jgi:glycosyltransferase involved in cell wall biosynthesis